MAASPPFASTRPWAGAIEASVQLVQLPVQVDRVGMDEVWWKPEEFAPAATGVDDRDVSDERGIRAGQHRSPLRDKQRLPRGRPDLGRLLDPLDPAPTHTSLPSSLNWLEPADWLEPVAVRCWQDESRTGRRRP